jgi:PTH1 family peptidyl-tRNA hydrolase
MRLVTGLGNPGKEYDGTPHNLGFAVVDELAKRVGVGFRRGPKPKMESVKLAGQAAVVLQKPMAYMNCSGAPVSAIMKWYGLKPDTLLVVCDDVNLPLGKLRLRSSGGPGGQKGLRSIIEALGSEEFARLRIGVGGGEPGADVGSHVLSKFRGERKRLAIAMVDEAATAVECWISEGLDVAMNRYNQ